MESVKKIKVQIGMKCWKCRAGEIVDKEPHDEGRTSIYECSDCGCWLDGDYQPEYIIYKMGVLNNGKNDGK